MHAQLSSGDTSLIFWSEPSFTVELQWLKQALDHEN